MVTGLTAETRVAPSAPAEVMFKVPPNTLTPLVILLAVPSVSVPAPSLVKPWLPASTELMVAVPLLTATFGEPLLTASVLLPPDRVQPYVLPTSPKTRLPTVMFVLATVTVSLPAISRVLKSARASTFVAITPPCQLPAVVQLPLKRLVQTPLVPPVTPATVSVTLVALTLSTTPG